MYQIQGSGWVAMMKTMGRTAIYDLEKRQTKPATLPGWTGRPNRMVWRLDGSTDRFQLPNHMPH